MSLNLRNSLQQYFGFEQFREGQEQTIQQLMNNNSCLAIFPTGSGKSLCYQLPAVHLPHLTLVVSPLLALMQDQLGFLAEKGIKAASIDSTLSLEQSQQIMADVRNGSLKVLMVSVERFKNERFRQFIQSVPVSMLVVDEAHCISEWGHNFRPDYLKLPAYRQALNIPLVLLLTATATKMVKRDMAQRFDIAEQHIVQTGFYRSNLDLSVVPVSSSQKNAQLLTQLSQQTGSGIVYVTLQQTAEQVARYLQQHNINAVAYHAGLDDPTRQQIQADFMQGRSQIVVATIAFGMGIDKADIRFVIHYDLPKSIENYSQEIGRAGRDGQTSNCITLANLDGLTTLENFVYGDTPEKEGIAAVISDIKQTVQNNQWECQLVGLSNATNVRQLPLKTLLVQLEIIGVIQPLYSYFADFKYKFLQPQADILALFDQDRQDFLSCIFAHTQFKKVWGTLNFDSLIEQYQFERKRVVAALDYLQEQNLIVLETKRITDVYQVNEEQLAITNLTEKLYQHFIEKEQKEIKRIAALVRFFELDRCLSHNLSLYFDDQRSPEHCGHCSVCRGQVAKLAYSQHFQWPEPLIIGEALNEFQQQVASKTEQPISTEMYCRFLAGISTPYFTRFKVRQLAGYGLCEQARYADIREQVQQLIQ